LTSLFEGFIINIKIVAQCRLTDIFKIARTTPPKPLKNTLFQKQHILTVFINILQKSLLETTYISTFLKNIMKNEIRRTIFKRNKKLKIFYWFCLLVCAFFVGTVVLLYLSIAYISLTYLTFVFMVAILGVYKFLFNKAKKDIKEK